jgi:hypothetical protein
LSEAAVSSTVLGISGSGDIGFDGSLDLKVIATPLSELKEQLINSGIPIIGPVAGEVAGAVVNVVNSATRRLLYSFEVKGTSDRPRVTPIPVPVLNNAVAGLFARMTSLGRNDHLLDAVKERRE